MAHAIYSLMSFNFGSQSKNVAVCNSDDEVRIRTVSCVHSDETRKIREVIDRFLSQCKIPFTIIQLDTDFHHVCCQEAVHRGYPMASSPSQRSLRPFIIGGVVMATTAYAHLKNQQTRIYIALYTAFLIYLDDVFQGDVELVSRFNEQFMQNQPQGDAILDAFAGLLREMPSHFGRVASNIMITSTLNLVTALLLEHEMQAMTLSPNACGFPTFSRCMSGASETYALFAFPPELPLQSYIQALPEMIVFINNGNDVLSFYKENLAGESVNRVSTLARCHGVTSIEVLSCLAEAAVACDTDLSEILAPHKEAHNAYKQFSHGYVAFHASLTRYRLSELM